MQLWHDMIMQIWERSKRKKVNIFGSIRWTVISIISHQINFFSEIEKLLLNNVMTMTMMMTMVSFYGRVRRKEPKRRSRTAAAGRVELSDCARSTSTTTMDDTTVFVNRSIEIDQDKTRWDARDRLDSAPDVPLSNDVFLSLACRPQLPPTEDLKLNRFNFISR